MLILLNYWSDMCLFGVVMQQVVHSYCLPMRTILFIAHILLHICIICIWFIWTERIPCTLDTLVHCGLHKYIVFCVCKLQWLAHFASISLDNAFNHRNWKFGAYCVYCYVSSLDILQEGRTVIFILICWTPINQSGCKWTSEF